MDASAHIIMTVIICINSRRSCSTEDKDPSERESQWNKECDDQNCGDEDVEIPGRLADQTTVFCQEEGDRKRQNDAGEKSLYFIRDSPA